MIPGDKSISQRALIISLASIGKTIIEGILDSEDVYHTLKAIKQLGAKVKIQGIKVSVWSPAAWPARNNKTHNHSSRHPRWVRNQLQGKKYRKWKKQF